MSEMLGRPDASDWQALKAENTKLRAALVEAARLLTLEQLQDLSEGAIRILADLGLLANQQQPRHIDDMIAELPTEQRTKIEERAAELISQQSGSEK